MNPRQTRRTDHGLLMRWFEAVTGALLRLSLGKALEKRRANRLDVYLVSWLAFEIVILIVLVYVSPAQGVRTALTVLLCYHLFEIAITSFNSVIIMPLERKRHRSVPRLFSLVLVDYVQIILIFAIIFNFLLPGDSVLESIQYSVSLATLAGTAEETGRPAVQAANIAELVFGIFFITGVIGTLANYLGSKE